MTLNFYIFSLLYLVVILSKAKLNKRPFTNQNNKNSFPMVIVLPISGNSIRIASLSFATAVRPLYYSSCHVMLYYSSGHVLLIVTNRAMLTKKCVLWPFFIGLSHVLLRWSCSRYQMGQKGVPASARVELKTQFTALLNSLTLSAAGSS